MVDQASIVAIITLLKEKSLLPFVIPVLFNICVDYGTWKSRILQSKLTPIRACTASSIGSSLNASTSPAYVESVYL